MTRKSDLTIFQKQSHGDVSEAINPDARDAEASRSNASRQIGIGAKVRNLISRRGFLGGASIAAALPLLNLRESLAEDSGADDSDDLLVIKKQGSFFVGGTKVQVPGTLDPFTANANASDAGQIYHYDHLYAQYQIPPNARRYPLVLVHGGGGTGRVWESTPDGREGYQSIFLRRGFPVYIVDFPRRGRAGYPSFNGPFGELLGTPIVANRTNRSGYQLAFVRWRLGPAYLQYFPNSQFPQTPGALDQFFSHLVPTVDDTTVIVNGLVALFDKIGPAILVTHSQSVTLGWQTAIRSPNVKGIVAYEGGSFFPVGELPAAIPRYDGSPSVPGTEVPLADFLKLTQMPIRIFYADGISQPSPFPGVDNMRLNLHYSGQMAAAVNRHGGDMSLIHFPEIGIYGNGHFSYEELNNVQIADLMSTFLRDKGLDRR
jgi:pimeloyl-ACP methyl ester carboxylesterase